MNILHPATVEITPSSLRCRIFQGLPIYPLIESRAVIPTALLKSRVILLLIIIAAMTAAGCAGGRAQQSGDQFYRSKNYVIYLPRSRDNLASIAERFLGDPRKAWLIEEANPAPLDAGTPVIIPLKPQNIGGLRPDGIQQVPVLCYHRFGDKTQSPLNLPVDIFEAQMKYLKDNGYHTISPAELLDFLNYRQPIPKKSVIITIDDGYESFFSVAYPILKKYEFTAILFIYTKFVGVSRQALSWNQLRDLKSAGFTIGSHSMAHSDLTKQGADESHSAFLERLREETVESKSIIDRKLDQATVVFAYPFGRWDPNAMAMVEQAGYNLAFTVDRGGNPFFSHPLALHRDQVLKRDMASFIKRLQTFQPFSLR